MATKAIYNGTRLSIHYLCTDDGVCPVEQFLQTLPREDVQKLDVLFQYLGDHGKIANREKFKKLEGTDGIFEFKSHQLRLLCFFTDDKRVIVCRALVKKRDRHNEADLDFAADCKHRFAG